jgi:hypothetical protein
MGHASESSGLLSPPLAPGAVLSSIRQKTVKASSAREAFPFAQRRSRLAPQYELAMKSIERVHMIQGFPICPISIADRKKHGSFRASDALGKCAIEMTYEAHSPALDLLYQIGHAIDWLGFYERMPGDKRYAITHLDSAEGFREVALKGETIERLQAELTEYALKGEMSFTDVRFYLSPEEVFARAYSQWIAVGSDDIILRSHLKVDQEAEAQKIKNLRWPDNEFELIIPELEKLFIGATGAELTPRQIFPLSSL